MSAPAFSRRAVVLLVLSAVAFFALSAILSSMGSPGLSGDRAGAGAYSVSAIGCAGFFDLLVSRGLPALISTGDPLSDAGRHGTVIVAAPDVQFIGSDGAMYMERARRLLLILPKWRGSPDEERPRWIAGVEPLPMIIAQEALALAPSAGSRVFRKEWPHGWAIDEIGHEPSGSGIVQLIRPESMKVLVGDGDGALLAEITEGDRKIWVLSDPDVVSNHGITKGGNAAFALALVEGLRETGNGSAGAPVVFDETAHGFHASDAPPYRALFSIPFSVVTVLAFCSALMMLWAGYGRFGAPCPAPSQLGFGKARLIDNSARLLDYGGHHAAALSRYVRMTVRSAARALHAPGGLDEPSLVEWLDRIGLARGVSGSCKDILRRADDADGTKGELAKRRFACAMDIYRWKGEVIDGSAERGRNRQSRQG
ncbi:MAG: hypothetical protein LBF92_04400 [Synergistaceae bacterium]|nr:hypothetical protein [Synergistaceae bacterium]